MAHADPIAARSYQKAYYQAHHAEKLARQKAYNGVHRAERTAYDKAWVQRNPEKVLLTKARGRARKYSLEFSIGIGDIHIPQTCPVLGIPLKSGNGTGRTQPGSPTLDRMDSSKGYVPGNVHVISYRANVIKNSGTAEEHRRIAEYMENAK
jgi:hypothetical protein